MWYRMCLCRLKKKWPKYWKPKRFNITNFLLCKAHQKIAISAVNIAISAVLFSYKKSGSLPINPLPIHFTHYINPDTLTLKGSKVPSVFLESKNSVISVVLPVRGQMTLPTKSKLAKNWKKPCNNSCKVALLFDAGTRVISVVKLQSHPSTVVTSPSSSESKAK